MFPTPLTYNGGETIESGLLAHNALVYRVELDETCVAGDWVIPDYAAMATAGYDRLIVHKPGSSADSPVCGLLLTGGDDGEYAYLLARGWVVPNADAMKAMYGPWAGLVSAKVANAATAGTKLQYSATAGRAEGVGAAGEDWCGVSYATPSGNLLTYLYVRTC